MITRRICRGGWGHAEEHGESPLTTPKSSRVEQAAGPLAGADVAAAWPNAQPRVAAVLAARGLQGADVDDIVQEVALRALHRDRPFASEDHFVGWCCRVAINLHVDGARRQRKLAASPPEDLASRDDTARIAEHRMDLEALAEGIAQLTADEQRLLLDPEPTSSRQEAVRLAVRRHRIRARLTSLIEGVTVGVPVLRKLLRSLSTPAKVSVAAAVPIVVTVSLLVVPSIERSLNDGPNSATGFAAREVPGAPAALIGTTTTPAADAPTTRSVVTAHARPTPPAAVAQPSAARTIAAVDTPAAPLRVTKEDRPDDEPTFCTGFLNTCVDRPGPTIPHPDLPLP